jgi:hypothetical protein
VHTTEVVEEERVQGKSRIVRVKLFFERHAVIVNRLSLLAGLAIAFLTIWHANDNGYDPLACFGLVAMGICEVTWIATSPGSKPSKKKPLRWHLVWFFVMIVAGFSLVAFSGSSKSPAKESHPDVFVQMFTVFLLAMAVGFLIVVVRAVVRSDDVLIASIWRNTSRGRLRLELWYGYAGAVSLGLGFGVLVRSHSGIWMYVILGSVAIVLTTCICIVVHWESLGPSRAEGNKFLVRQSSLPNSIATASGVMLVPTLVEFLATVLRERRLASRALDLQGSDGSRTSLT